MDTCDTCKYSAMENIATVPSQFRESPIEVVRVCRKNPPQLPPAIFSDQRVTSMQSLSPSIFSVHRATFPVVRNDMSCGSYEKA